MIDLIIVGAGGFGREVYHWLSDWIGADRNRQVGFRIKGFLSIDADILDNYTLPVTILGDESTYAIQPDDRFVMGIGTTQRKRQVAQRLRAKDAQFMTLIHPTAIVSQSATVGLGSVVCPNCVICADVSVGEFAMFNIYSSAGHDAVVGDYSVLSPYATLNGFAKLNEEVFMGSHSTVVASKTIGERSRISANTLVVNNVPPDTTVLGNPGKMIPNF